MSWGDGSTLSKNPDWSKFPQELRYISEYVDRYRPLLDKPRFSPDRLTKKQVRELDRLATLIGSRNHFVECSHVIMEHLYDSNVEADHLGRFLSLIDSLRIANSDYGPREPDAIFDCWERLNYRLWWQLIPETVEILGDDTFDFVRRYFDRIPKKDQLRWAIGILLPLRSDKTLDWIEDNISDEPQSVLAFDNWGRVAAMSRLTWPRVVRWLERGGLLTIVAIDALGYMVGTSAACSSNATLLPLPCCPPLDDAERHLRPNLEGSIDPELSKKIEAILKRWHLLSPG